MNQVGLLDKTVQVTHLLEADQTISVGIQESGLEMDCTFKNETETDVGQGHHSHKTVKQSCITRWSSIITMVDSILCLYTGTNEALKSNGNHDYCLTEDDRLILCELQKFLQPFAELTELLYLSSLQRLKMPQSLLSVRANVSPHWKFLSSSICYTASRWRRQFKLQHLQTLYWSTSLQPICQLKTWRNC